MPALHSCSYSKKLSQTTCPCLSRIFLIRILLLQLYDNVLIQIRKSIILLHAGIISRVKVELAMRSSLKKADILLQFNIAQTKAI